MRDIKALHPKLQEIIPKLKEECEKKGITIAISECVRTVKEQNDLFAQGRTKPGKIVTKCKGDAYSSMHQWGVAFDFYLDMDIDGDGVKSDDAFNNAKKYFEKVGAIGKKLGLEWGGDWKSIKDTPHFQLPDWGSTAAKLKSTYGTPEKFMKTWNQKTAAKPTTTTKKATVKTSGSTLSVRDCDGNYICSIPNKSTVTVLEKDSKTLKINGTKYLMTNIKYGNIVGFVASKYLLF